MERGLSSFRSLYACPSHACGCCARLWALIPLIMSDERSGHRWLRLPPYGLARKMRSCEGGEGGGGKLRARCGQGAVQQSVAERGRPHGHQGEKQWATKPRAAWGRSWSKRAAHLEPLAQQQVAHMSRAEVKVHVACVGR